GDGFVVQSGALVLPASGGATVSVPTGTASIASVLTGEGGLTKTGEGTLVVGPAVQEEGENAGASGPSVGFTFGDGTQGPASGDVGPVVQQAASTWNNVNATAGAVWPNNGNDGWNNFSGNWTGDLGNLASDGTTLANPVQIQIVDPNQQFIWDNWTGGWGGEVGTSAVASPAGDYNQQYACWGTSNSDWNQGPVTVTFSNIPYANYDVYIAGANLVYGSTPITTAGTHLTGLSGASFTLTGTTHDAYNADAYILLSYIQIVSKSGAGTGVPDPTTPDMYEGATVIASGTLKTAHVGNLGTGDLVLGSDSSAGATLRITGGGVTDRAITLAGAATIESGGAEGPLVLNGPIVGAGQPHPRRRQQGRYQWRPRPGLRHPHDRQFRHGRLDARRRQHHGRRHGDRFRAAYLDRFGHIGHRRRGQQRRAGACQLRGPELRRSYQRHGQRARYGRGRPDAL
ncbi:MAG: hypothetical protein WCK05_13435, partial [Planctomycetota bacterium]